MKNLLYTLLVGLPLSSFGQVVTPEAQQLVALSSNSISDFEYDGIYAYVLTREEQQTTLSVYNESILMDSKSFPNASLLELGRRCEGGIVLYQDETYSAVNFDKKSLLSFGPSSEINDDCHGESVLDKRPVIVSSDEDQKVIAFHSNNKWDTVTIVFNESLDPTIKNPGKTANLSGSDQKNTHDRSLLQRTTYPTPKGEYSEPETRVLHEGSMEHIRKAQYKDGAMNMETTQLESRFFIVNDKIVAINPNKEMINTYTLAGELIASKPMTIPRPAVWVKDNEDFFFNAPTQQLFLLSNNSSGTQLYSLDIETGKANPILSEKKSTNLISWKPSEYGVTYLVERKGVAELKFAEVWL